MSKAFVTCRCADHHNPPPLCMFVFERVGAVVAQSWFPCSQNTENWYNPALELTWSLLLRSTRQFKLVC